MLDDGNSARRIKNLIQKSFVKLKNFRGTIVYENCLARFVFDACLFKHKNSQQKVC